MNKAFEVFQKLVLSTELNLEDYYTSSLWQGSIKLQGNFSNRLVKSLRHFKVDDKYSEDIADEGWVLITFVVDGVYVEITLT